MKALIAFIVMALAIVVLIEINERRKAKKASKTPSIPLEGEDTDEECQKEQSGQEDCSGCGLIDVCEKEEKKKTGR